MSLYVKYFISEPTDFLLSGPGAPSWAFLWGPVRLLSFYVLLSNGTWKNMKIKYFYLFLTWFYVNLTIKVCRKISSHHRTCRVWVSLFQYWSPTKNRSNKWTQRFNNVLRVVMLLLLPSMLFFFLKNCSWIVDCGVGCHSDEPCVHSSILGREMNPSTGPRGSTRQHDWLCREQQSVISSTRCHVVLCSVQRKSLQSPREIH